jgi:cell division protein ZapA
LENDLIPVNLMLSGRSYRIRVRADEEATVRRAVKIADEKINELRRSYAGKDDQDFLAMCLLMYAAEAAVDSPAEADTTEVAALIERIDQALAKD